MSLPSRERGLKSIVKVSAFYDVFVAPLAGAWIEIHASVEYGLFTAVAPLAGAWIEITANAR